MLATEAGKTMALNNATVINVGFGKRVKKIEGLEQYVKDKEYNLIEEHFYKNDKGEKIIIDSE